MREAASASGVLRVIDDRTPKHLDLHLIVDHYATHKHPEVKKGPALHPRFRLHFTPTSSSWLNLVERFFPGITRKRVRRGVFKSVTDLEIAIHHCLAEYNAPQAVRLERQSCPTPSPRSAEGNRCWSRNTRCAFCMIVERRVQPTAAGK